MSKTEPQADPYTLRALAKIADQINYLWWAMKHNVSATVVADYTRQAENLASELRKVAEEIERD